MILGRSWSSVPTVSSAGVAGLSASGGVRSYCPWTENEVVSACSRSAVTPKVWRARRAKPAKRVVTSWAYNQSSVRPRQSSLRASALMPGPSRCSTGLSAKSHGRRGSCLPPPPLQNRTCHVSGHPAPQSSGSWSLSTGSWGTFSLLSPAVFLSWQCRCSA